MSTQRVLRSGRESKAIMWGRVLVSDRGILTRLAGPAGLEAKDGGTWTHRARPPAMCFSILRAACECGELDGVQRGEKGARDKERAS